MNSTDIKKKIKKVSESKVFGYVVFGLGILFVAVLVFQAGVFVGFHKASFDRDNFSRTFGPERGQMMDSAPENFPNAHGTIGTIIKADYPTITVEDRDGTEKVVLIDDDTVIRKLRDTGTKDDLVTGTSVVVIGSPDATGEIDAKLIRIIPNPPSVPSVPATHAAPMIPAPTN